MSGDRYVLEECHEEVADADGRAEPCNRPAIGWRIDPEENQPYPVCVTHHRWPYADEWVAAVRFVKRVQALCDEHIELISVDKVPEQPPRIMGRYPVL